MKLLLTNDDGIESPGIQTLASILAEYHDIWIVAPDRNRSAVSHGITMSSPLCLRKVDTQAYACSGVPADCTINGLSAILPEKPDAVISGINLGGNLGTDVLYSGTAAAARQAVLSGIPGIALSSVSNEGPWDFTAFAVFVRKNLELLLNLCAPDVFLNINAPTETPFKGCKQTMLSKRRYFDSIKLYSAPDGHSYSFFAGGRIETEEDRQSDYAAVQAGYISVSRVYVQPSTASCSEFEHFKFEI